VVSSSVDCEKNQHAKDALGVLTRLPVELVALIFAFAAIGDQETASSLMCVCRQTRSWTQLVLYRVVALTSYPSLKAFANTVNANPALAEHIRHLWVGSKNPHPESTKRFYRLDTSDTPSKRHALVKLNLFKTNWRRRQEKAVRLTLQILQHCPNLLTLSMIEEGSCRLFEQPIRSFPFQLLEIAAYRGVPFAPDQGWAAALQHLRHIRGLRSPCRFAEQGSHFINDLQELESLEIAPVSIRDESAPWVDLQTCVRRLKSLPDSVKRITLRVDAATAKSEALETLMGLNERVEVIDDFVGVEAKDYSFIYKEWLARSRSLYLI
jgi:hypothetical protein